MRRFVAIITSLLVALNFVWVKPASAAVDYSIVRVKLNSIGTRTSIAITVKGDYSVKENSSVSLEQKDYTIRLENDSLILTDGSKSWSLGSRFTLKRHHGSLAINNSGNSVRNYLGDMEFRVENGSLILINHVHLELYLYGVLPFEMSNSWPMEALKAQAVAARTFAVDKIRARSNSSFHLDDTQNSQVYGGYNKTYANCIQAVNTTEGQVLMYSNTFAQTFYSSSNGGMTERAANIFSSDFPYLVVKTDPHDIANSSNTNASWQVTYTKTPVDSGLRSRVITQIQDSLASRGYRTAQSDIAIQSIKELNVVHNDSGRLKDGSLVVILDAKKASDGTVETIEETVKLTKNNTRLLLNLKSLLFQVENADNAFILKGGGYGHGVGMSQYGAQQMARGGSNHNAILEFYYPGTVLTQLNNSARPDADYIPPAPSPQPTPAPTPKPTTVPTPAPEPSEFGRVKVNTNLNVRQGAGTQYKVVGSLSNNTRVEIIGELGQWYQIKSGKLAGYVSKPYIMLETPNNPPSNPPSNPGGTPGTTPPPDPALPPNQDKTGLVTASTLNIRNGPGTNNHKVGMVVKGKKVTIHDKVGEWYKITYNTIQGYVHGSYIQIQNPVPNLPSTSTGTVKVTSLNVRSGVGTGYSRIGSLRNGAKVTLLSYSNGWYRIQSGSLVGYVHGDYIVKDSGQLPDRGDSSKPVTATVKATSLNVRSGAGTGYRIIGSLRNHTKVEIQGVSGSWYKIKNGSLVGYVHGNYLKLQ